jgi:hypothetical protein
MLDRMDRVLLVLLLVMGFGLGVWAGFFPESFYKDFPGGGRHWVAADGPYNEHLVRDVGNASLALGVVALTALLRPVRELVLAAAMAFLVLGLPHLAYHLRHLDVYDTSDQIASITSLAIGVVIPAVLLVRNARGLRRPTVTGAVPAPH